MVCLTISVLFWYRKIVLVFVKISVMNIRVILLNLQDLQFKLYQMVLVTFDISNTTLLYTKVCLVCFAYVIFGQTSINAAVKKIKFFGFINVVSGLTFFQ